MYINMIQRFMFVILTRIYRGQYEVTEVYRVNLKVIRNNNDIFPGLPVRSLEVTAPS